MPIYEYACERCKKEFEVEQRITEEPLKRCPSCRSTKIKRLISQTSFVLKGGGWYSDLYSSSKDKKASSREKKEGGKQAGDKEASTSTDKKPSSESKKNGKNAQAAA